VPSDEVRPPPLEERGALPSSVHDSGGLEERRPAGHKSARVPQRTPPSLPTPTAPLNAALHPTRAALPLPFREGGKGVRSLPIAEIIAAIDRAVTPWGDPHAIGRAEVVKALSEETGYSPAMVDRALYDIARTFRASELWRLLRRELPEPAVLDRFVARPAGGYERAYGPELTAIVLSGNVFPVAAESMILSLLAKSPCLVKASTRDRLFPDLFARSLTAADPRIAESLAVTWWPGGDTEIERAVFGAAGAVIVYGGAEAVAAVRERTPATTRFIAHGPKISFGIVAPTHASDPATARAAADDVSIFDQQGCVSPHTLYVLGGPEHAFAFARLLAVAMAQVELATPRGRLSVEDAARIHQARGAAEFRPDVDVLIPPTGTAWTVIADPDPAFAVSCLNRVVYVKPLAQLDDLPHLLAFVQPYLQTAGVAGDDPFRLMAANILGPLGVARVCRLGRMQRPPADWRHDGRPRLLDLLRWTEIEA
jgi:hypothetical protein